jgi:hypothetical protein
VLTQIHTLWQTAKACCELVSGHRYGAARILVWVGSCLVHEQLVSSYTEALAVAESLKRAYG